jgi:hypothetical protein
MDNTEILARLNQLGTSDSAAVAQLSREIAAESRMGGETIIEQWAKAPGGHAPNLAFVAADLREMGADAMLQHGDHVSPALRARFFDLLADAGAQLLRALLDELRPLLTDRSPMPKSQILPQPSRDWRMCDEAYVLMRRLVPAHHKQDPPLPTPTDFTRMTTAERDSAIRVLKDAKAATPRE